MTLQTIGKTLNKYNPLFERNAKSKIRNGGNVRLSTLLRFLKLTDYNLSLKSEKCNSVDDIRQKLASTDKTTYEIGRSGVHTTQFNNFIKGKNDIDTKTLLLWCEVLEIQPTLEKS